MKPLAATSGACLNGTHELCQRQMRPIAVTGARWASAATPKAERVGYVPPASRRAICRADVQQSAASTSFRYKMVPANDAPLLQ